MTWLARRLGLAAGVPPAPQAVLEISSTQVLNGDVLSFHVDDLLPVCGAALADIPLPEEAAVMLVVRGSELLAARGNTVLQDGDHVHLFCRREDRPLVELLFGRAGED